MKLIYTCVSVFALSIAALTQVNAQANYPNLLYNNGDVIYVQSGAVLHVQGDVVNASGSTVTNNGLLNVEGDFNNAGTFQTDVNVGEGTVRFIGSNVVSGAVAGSTTTGAQTILGNMSTSGTASFYNLVIDREAAGQPVVLGTNVLVTGSLLWNNVNGTTSAATYSPSTYTSTIGNTGLMAVRGQTRTGNGLIKLYNGTNDYGLFISNGVSNSVVGYQSLGSYSYSGSAGGSAVMATSDQYFQSRGNSTGVATGLSRLINGSGVYTFPVGSPNKSYNPIQVNFPSLQTNLQLTCKFTEDASLTGSSGNFQTIFNNQYDLSNSTLTTTQSNYITHNPNFVQNPGYNVYQPDCIGNKKWFIMNSFVTNHGYWSFATGTPPASGSVAMGSGTLNGYYTIQAFPHGYTDVNTTGSNGTNKRLVRENADNFVTEPTAANFNAQVNSYMNSPSSDILKYSYLGQSRGSFISCDDATGITGGAYTAFSHFAIGTSSIATDQALPVTLIGLNADPVNNAFIRVSWSTASEQDNKGFEVQRSTDGQNFTTIGWVDGNGSTDIQHNYDFNDNTVSPDLLYYYRLNQVDVDGVGNLTYIVSAMITDGPNVTVSEFQPNPTTGAARLVISTTESQPVSVKFYDMLGKVVLSGTDMATYGTNTMDFDMSSLSDATYTAVIKIGGNSYTKKIVVLSK